MKNKGFTILELLAVIVILAIIAVITVPNVVGVLNTAKDSLSEEQKLAIENAARAWGIKNLSLNDEDKPSREYITIKEFQDDGAIERKTLANLKNIDIETAGVCISYDNYQFVYKYVNNKEECD